jgi:hypothetical protein
MWKKKSFPALNISGRVMPSYHYILYKSWGIMADLDDVEELEEELEPLEVLDLDEEEAAPEEESSKYFSSSLNPFLTSLFPVLFVDNKLKIIYANPACENLFTGFLTLREIILSIYLAEPLRWKISVKYGKPLFPAKTVIPGRGKPGSNPGIWSLFRPGFTSSPRS